jgi:hypothetical protein
MPQLTDAWTVYALVLFAVAAGQLGRIGHRLEHGDVPGWRQILVELSMLPAFGSLGGAIAVAQGWPAWVQLACGISAGWSGFGMFRMIVGTMRHLAARLIESSGKPET